MKRIFILLLILTGANSLFAKLEKEILTNIFLENGKDKPWYNLVFGIAPDATDTMDVKYGEEEIPNWPFPAGVFTAVFMTYSEDEQQDIWSYRSVVPPHADSLKFFKKFRFRVFYGNASHVVMKWGKLPSEIDSAVISDPFGGKFFRVNMKDTTQQTNYEYLIDEFDIYVYYNIDPNSVEEFESNDFNIYPNPAKENVSLVYEDNLLSIIIFDELGTKVREMSGNSVMNLYVGNWPAGTYFVQFNNLNGNSYVKKLLISK